MFPKVLKLGKKCSTDATPDMAFTTKLMFLDRIFQWSNTWKTFHPCGCHGDLFLSRILPNPTRTKERSEGVPHWLGRTMSPPLLCLVVSPSALSFMSTVHPPHQSATPKQKSNRFVASLHVVLLADWRVQITTQRSPPSE